MELGAFVAGAGAITLGLAVLSKAAKDKRAKAEKDFDDKASRAVVTAPYTGPVPQVEHVQVPHLRDYFNDLPSFEK